MSDSKILIMPFLENVVIYACIAIISTTGMIAMDSYHGFWSMCLLVFVNYKINRKEKPE